MDYTQIDKYVDLFQINKPTNLEKIPKKKDKDKKLEKNLEKKSEKKQLELLNGIIICPDCNIPTTTHGLNIWECTKCGSFVESLIDQTAEWRIYQDGTKNDTIRCSTVINELLPQSSKGTIILSKSNSNYNMRRTQKVHSWSAMTYKERCLNDIFQDISLRSLNGCILQNVVKLAHEYYSIVSELYIARGAMRKGLVAACLFMACKKQGVPRTCQEIAEIFQINDKSVTRGNKKFIELWSMAGQNPISYKNDDQSTNYLPRFCSELNPDSDELLKISKQITILCKKNSILTSNTPISIAAASIYMATIILNIESDIQKSDIATVAKTSQVTIGKCYKELQKFKQIIYSDSEIKKIVAKLSLQ